MRIGTAIDVHGFEQSRTLPGEETEIEPARATSQDSESAAKGAGQAPAARHRPQRPLMLACLEWPDETPLAGHSDGDAAAHAACDALLIAAGIGEMGTIFGTARPEYAGASGAEFLRETVRLVREAGFAVNNISVQIIAQRPRFAPRKAEAEARMSEIIGAPVAVAATTTDHLGFIGAGEGIAAIATALLARI